MSSDPAATPLQQAAPLGLSFEEFAARRAEQRAWAFANGFNNADPASNGEYACVLLLAPLSTHVVDVGAHLGAFAAVAMTANSKASLTLVEPNSSLQAHLLKNFPNACVMGCAMSDQPGQGWLLVHAEHPAAASLSARTLMNPSFRAKMNPMQVDVVRLDDQREFEPRDRPLYLKIDAEGYEAKIMRGGERTLMIPAAAMVHFRYSQSWRETGESFHDAFFWLEQRGFDIRRITPYGLERVSFVTAELENVQYANYVALRGVALDTITLEIQIPTLYGFTSFARFPESVAGPDTVFSKAAAGAGPSPGL